MFEVDQVAVEVNNVVALEEARGPLTLKRLAEIDPDVRGLLGVLKDAPELRSKAIELLEKELERRRYLRAH